MLPSALWPTGVALGFAARDSHINSWAAIGVQWGVVLAILALQLVRQRRMDKPHKIWRATPWVTFVLETGSVISAVVALACMIGIWLPEYDNSAVASFFLGHAIAGSLICAVMIPIWIAQAKHGEGPMKKNTMGAVATYVVGVVVSGPIIASIASVPLGIFWTEEMIRVCPGNLSRQTWSLTATVVAVGVLTMIFTSHELRRQLAKQARG